MRTVLMAFLLAGCATTGGRATVLGAGDPGIDVACVLVADGALCTFSASDTAGQRCVVVAYATRKGDPEIADQPTCSGPLDRAEQTTRVVRFGRRPAEAGCGPALGRCSSLIVPYGEEAAQALADARAKENAPPSEADCETVVHHLYDIWRREDCRGKAPPELVACERELAKEEQEQGPEIIAECARNWDRQRLECERVAASDSDIARCEDEFDERQDGQDSDDY
jgi:hypothetical protein